MASRKLRFPGHVLVRQQALAMPKTEYPRALTVKVAEFLNAALGEKAHAPSGNKGAGAFGGKPFAPPVPFALYSGMSRETMTNETVVDKEGEHTGSGSYLPNLRWYICGLLFFASTVELYRPPGNRSAKSRFWKKKLHWKRGPTTVGSSRRSSLRTGS